MPAATIPLIKHYAPDAPLIYTPYEVKSGHEVQGNNTTQPKSVIYQSEFLSAALDLANKLPSHRYAINLCQDRSYFLLSFAAVLLRRMTNLLPPSRQPKTVADTASDYPDCFCITDSDLAHSTPSVFRLDNLDIYSQATSKAIIESPVIDADHIAAITFTSGSTGKPTANNKPWRTLAGTAERLAKRFFSNETPPAILATAPSQHMYGLEMIVMMALQGGCSMDARQPFYPQDIAAALKTLPRPRLLVTTPVHLRALQGAGIDMPQVDRVISATAPLSEALATESENIFRAPVEEIYGCTEAGSTATRRTNATDEWLLLDDMQLSQNGKTTEVSGPHLSQSVELSDRLQVLSDNRFRFLGRSGDMLIVAGKRASLIELNQKLLEISGIEDGVIFVPERDDNKTSRPAALVISALSEREILAALSQQIDPIFLPRPLRKVPSLPRNETGKLLRNDLERLLSLTQPATQKQRSTDASE